MSDHDDDEFSDADDDGPEGLRSAPRGGDEDDFDEFDDSMADYGQGRNSGGAQTMAVTNQPFDEAVELSESEDNASNASPMPNTGKGGGAGGAGRGNDPQRRHLEADSIANQPFDEAHDLTSEGSVSDNDEAEEAAAQFGGGGGGGGGRLEDGEHEIPGLRDAQEAAKAQMGSSQGMGAAASAIGETRGARQAAPDLDALPSHDRGGPSVVGGMNAPKGGGDDDDDEYGGSNEGGAGAPVAEGMYDPADFANLQVNAEIKELFQYITRYKPHNIELETKMRPFIPDYIPAVGDIDPFIKVPRPDGKADNLGLVTMDEPASVQSDPTVLTLQLRAVTKSSGAQPMLVRSVEHAEKDPKAITGWINSIADLHRHKPAPSVRYKKPMPDIEQLMQIWPAPIEEMLESVPLPDADINLDLASYVRTVCAMLDIPVHDNLTESLHVLFTLYSDFKANVHFQQQLATEQPGMGEGDGFGADSGEMGGMGGGPYSPGGGAETLSLS